MSTTPQPPKGSWPLPPVKSISDSIFEPVSQLYKIGGFILVWTFIGTLLVITALITVIISSAYIVAYCVGAVGTLIILASFVLSIIMRKYSSGSLEDSREAFDTIKDMATEMTVLAERLQALAFKYEEEITLLIPEARYLGLPLSSTLQHSPNTPAEQEFREGLRKLVVEYEQAVRKEYSQGLRSQLPASVTQFTVDARAIIERVKLALTSNNPVLLRKPLADLKEANAGMIKLLAEEKKNSIRY